LFALKHGASLVWGPEVIDKAILFAERVVDPNNGVVYYMGKSQAIWTTHPIEKPYLIYQMGSADPELAVQAAQKVMHDVSGIDLNCGCPKSFSTHAGMGAALLTNPDLLISILTALRTALPPEISVSCKIRLLPSHEDTLKLVERIVNTGVNALTVHCRTRNMRPRERALIERMRGVVEFVEGLGKDVAVIQNGDCIGFEDAKRIREITKAHSVMIATAAESNPSCFSPTPLMDVGKTLIPQYLQVAKHLNISWALTKFCSTQFKGGRVELSKDDMKIYKEVINRGKSYDDISSLVDGTWNGEQEFAEIVKAIDSRVGRKPPHVHLASSLTYLPPTEGVTYPKPKPPKIEPVQISSSEDTETALEGGLKTPPTSGPDPALLHAPRSAANDLRIPIPAVISGSDAATPTPLPQDPASPVPLAA